MSSKLAVALMILVGQVAIAPSARGQDRTKYYTVQHPTEFAINWKGFYEEADRLTAEVRKQLPHTLDQAYGMDPKQQLDVYLPAMKPASAPVFIFLHGGGFREGDRAHYGFVAKPLAANGIVTVVASYRLLPAAHYPDQFNDTQQIVEWVYRNIASHGGDPTRIYIGGHSAGAMLTAQVGVNTAWLTRRSLPDGIIKGCVPMSGTYDLDKRVGDYVPDVSRRAEANPMTNITKPAAHWIISVGSAENSRPPILPADSEAFGAKLREKGVSADVIVLQELDHSQTALALGDARSPLVQAILAMVRSTPGL